MAFLQKPIILRNLPIISVLQRVTFSDAIEKFTTDLISKRRSDLKWNSAARQDLTIVRKSTKNLLKEINSIYDSVLCVDIRKVTPDQLDTLVSNAISDHNQSDLVYLAQECMKWDCLPRIHTCLALLESFEKERQFDCLEKFYDFCLTSGVANELVLRLFRVKSHWREGNADKALKLLDRIHAEVADAPDISESLVACKDLFRFLISDAVGQKSEAVLLKLVHLIETIDDVLLMEELWNALFISNWFSDQQLALSLFRRHAALRLRLAVQTNYTTFLFLREHNVDAVYRLVELLLSHEMMHECQRVLGLLFDYQCKWISVLFSFRSMNHKFSHAYSLAQGPSNMLRDHSDVY